MGDTLEETAQGGAAGSAKRYANRDSAGRRAIVTDTVEVRPGRTIGFAERDLLIDSGVGQGEYISLFNTFTRG
ncbi:hypothetical protein WN982_32645 [Paraburkholderia sp. IMGN_8]|uniref:hypothetical protein n=1 Tax=Paraburkholderia sp. IMGN_8 TaxID=3136564 RepID=UPI00310133FD